MIQFYFVLFNKEMWKIDEIIRKDITIERKKNVFQSGWEGGKFVDLYQIAPRPGLIRYKIFNKF